jgi:hypothetical protein
MGITQVSYSLLKNIFTKPLLSLERILFDIKRHSSFDCSTNELHDGTNENTSLSQDCFSEHSQTHSDPSYPTNTVMETPHHLDYIDNHLPFFEDFIPHTPAITLSTYAQIEKTINITEKHQNNDEV